MPARPGPRQAGGQRGGLSGRHRGRRAWCPLEVPTGRPATATGARGPRAGVPTRPAHTSSELPFLHGNVKGR